MTRKKKSEPTRKQLIHQYIFRLKGAEALVNEIIETFPSLHWSQVQTMKLGIDNIIMHLNYYKGKVEKK